MTATTMTKSQNSTFLKCCIFMGEITSRSTQISSNTISWLCYSCLPAKNSRRRSINSKHSQGFKISDTWSPRIVAALSTQNRKSCSQSWIQFRWSRSKWQGRRKETGSPIWSRRTRLCQIRMLTVPLRRTMTQTAHWMNRIPTVIMASLTSRFTTNNSKNN